MRSIDLTPLMRATVGFDRLFDMIDSGQVERGVPSYPPYNIEKTGEDRYRITMAVAGFSDAELNVTVKESSLAIAGKKGDEAEGSQFLHRGIATRSFERRFDLADHIQVTGAKVENGLLHVDLVRELPEAAKPRSIKIEVVEGQKAPTLENQAA